MMRKCLFWAHLAAGLLAGSVVLALCVTGALLAFERQIIDLAERDARAEPPSPRPEWVPPAVLIANATRLHPGKVANIEWLAGARMPVRIFFFERSVAMLNAWTGEGLGGGAESWRAFFRVTTAVHTSLAWRLAGKRLVDVANVTCVFLVLSGLWLWWPRQWRWKALRNSVAIRFDVGGKARDWNWHNALGFWFMLPLLILAASGVVLSFKSADLWWRDFAEKHLLAPARPPVALALPVSQPPGWNGVLSTVTEQNPGWRSIMLTTGPSNTEGIVNLMVCMGAFGQRSLIRNVSVDQASYRIVKVSAWENQAASIRARALARFSHSGEIVGLWGQALALAACLAGVVLVYTGFALSWRRFFRRRRGAGEGLPG